MSYWVLPCSLIYLTPVLRIFFDIISMVFSAIRLPFNLIISHKKKTEEIETTKGSRYKLAKDHFNSSLGLYEYYVRAPRNVILGIAFLIIVLVRTFFLIKEGDFSKVLPQLGFPLLFLALTIYSNQNKIHDSLKIAEFLRMNPALRPKFFFDTYYRLLGPLSYALPNPSTAPVVNPEKISCSKMVHSKQTILPLIPTMWDTAHLAHISLKTLKHVGPEYAREIFDIMASMWGKRVLELFDCNFAVTGSEKLRDLHGKIILVMNHKSQLDFILTFLCEIMRLNGSLMAEKTIEIISKKIRRTGVK